MSKVFREYLQKVGSGSHTSKDLSREESARATEMMLRQEATPAQIGAFLIAHRIKRPTGEELAGMLDAYDRLGPKLQPIASSYVPLVLGTPYDGRDRTAPVTVLVALVLASVGCPVILHGGTRMPTKYGVPLVELWQQLGVDWTGLSLEAVQRVLATHQVGFVYVPNHFPAAAGLVPYRDQIGKRPPLATVELIWCPYGGECLRVAGYVHPPTEVMFQTALHLHGVTRFLTVKGLEGSCDLPRSRTAILGVSRADREPSFERILLHPRDYGFALTQDLPLESEPWLAAEMQRVLKGEGSELEESVVWNGGFYLWQVGAVADLAAGFGKVRSLLKQGEVLRTLDRLRGAVNP